MRCAQSYLLSTQTTINIPIAIKQVCEADRFHPRPAPNEKTRWELNVSRLS
jgi:hypothetical protein